jgi:3-hydroxy acid dehydrogenase/malonic semialdehyde reductase
MASLKGQLAFVTGASSGIGLATAHAFAREGTRLILAARRLQRLETLASELKQAHGTECLCLPLDVGRHKAVAAELEKIPQPWRAIDVLVNNAGLSRGLVKLHEGGFYDWDEMIDTNIKGLLAVSRTVIPWMIARNRGHIINIGSIAGHEVYPNGNVYCATKFAVRAISQGMKLDLHGTPIRVTSIDPGLVETEFSLVRFRGDQDRATQPYKGMKPLVGEDIAEAIVWCAGRPDHVNIAEMIVLPTAQSSATMVHREP